MYYDKFLFCTTLSVLPSYEPSWLAVLGTRRKNKIHSFIIKHSHAGILFNAIGQELIVCRSTSNNSHSHVKRNCNYCYIKLQFNSATVSWRTPPSSPLPPLCIPPGSPAAQWHTECRQWHPCTHSKWQIEGKLSYATPYCSGSHFPTCVQREEYWELVLTAAWRSWRWTEWCARASDYTKR